MLDLIITSQPDYLNIISTTKARACFENMKDYFGKHFYLTVSTTSRLALPDIHFFANQKTGNASAHNWREDVECLIYYLLTSSPSFSRLSERTKRLNISRAQLDHLDTVEGDRQSKPLRSKLISLSCVWFLFVWVGISLSRKRRLRRVLN